MSRRIRFGLAFAAMSLGATVGAQAVLAAAAPKHLRPANTTVKIALKAGTKASFTGKLGAVTVTSNCGSATDSFKTPARGLGPFKLANPAFTRCTDTLGGKDTVTTNSTHGRWSEKFISAARVRLTIPKAGATVVSSLVPTCVITVAPTGPVTVTGTYDNVRTTKFKNVTLPASTSAACPGGATKGTATFSATYVSTPHVKVVP
jgi:hypothetical protein